MRRTRPARYGVGAAVVALLALAVGAPALAATTTTTTTTAPSTSTPSWTVYHGNPAGSGIAASVSSVTLSSPAWTSPALDGQLYGEPLAWDGHVFVATENDTVYALSAATGAVEWSSHVGTPVPSGSLPCGDISPTVGITGTPVIDGTRAELFVVADELVHGSPAHELVGLSTDTGKTELTQDVDPAGSTPSALLQRTGLTLDAGRVVFGMGGNYGDCASYRGRVISVPESGGTPADFTVDSAAGESQGAIWMGGAAPVVDANGDIWVEAGNGSVYSSAHAYDDSDSVLELSPSLTLLQYFAPSSWPSNNANDLDMSTAPALLADGQVVAAGKSRIVYLLNGSSLGGIGSQQASLGNACGDDIDGGVAVVGTTVYLPCLSGTIAVQASSAPARLHLLWSSSVGGGPPIVAAGLVWTIGQDGELYGLNPTTGAVHEQASVGVPANHFPTPAVGAGLLLAPAADRVVAFSAPSASASTTTSPTTTSTTAAPRTTTTAGATTTSAPEQQGGSNTGAIVAAVIGGLVVVGGLVWLLLRRRQRNQ
ncbi:MAG: PQQ-binding-like beta-propeller repeat protein [Acidimicrobiales bacterium]